MSIEITLSNEEALFESPQEAELIARKIKDRLDSPEGEVVLKFSGVMKSNPLSWMEAVFQSEGESRKYTRAQIVEYFLGDMGYDATLKNSNSSNYLHLNLTRKRVA